MKETEKSSILPQPDVTIQTSSYQAPTLPDEVFVLLLKFLGVNDVMGKIVVLSKRTKELVRSENYIMFKHFLRNFNLLNDRLKRADTPAKVCVMQLLRDNFRLRMDEPQPKKLDPFSYYTDGGTYNDEMKYFITNIFSRSGVCYSTKTPKNTNVQLYLGRQIEADPSKM